MTVFPTTLRKGLGTEIKMIFSKIFQYISLKYNLFLVFLFISAGLYAQTGYRKNTKSGTRSVSSCKNIRSVARKPRKKKWNDTDIAKAKKTKQELKNGDLLAYFRKDACLLILLTSENWYSGSSFRERHLFAWTSSRKDSVRHYAGRNKRAPLSFAGQRFAEAIIDFRNGKYWNETQYE